MEQKESPPATTTTDASPVSVSAQRAVFQAVTDAPWYRHIRAELRTLAAHPATNEDVPADVVHEYEKELVNQVNLFAIAAAQQPFLLDAPQPSVMAAWHSLYQNIKPFIEGYENRASGLPSLPEFERMLPNILSQASTLAGWTPTPDGIRKTETAWRERFLHPPKVAPDKKYVPLLFPHPEPPPLPVQPLVITRHWPTVARDISAVERATIRLAVQSEFEKIDHPGKPGTSFLKSVRSARDSYFKEIPDDEQPTRQAFEHVTRHFGESMVQYLERFTECYLQADESGLHEAFDAMANAYAPLVQSLPPHLRTHIPSARDFRAMEDIIKIMIVPALDKILPPLESISAPVSNWQEEVVKLTPAVIQSLANAPRSDLFAHYDVSWYRDSIEQMNKALTLLAETDPENFAQKKLPIERAVSSFADALRGLAVDSAKQRITRGVNEVDMQKFATLCTKYKEWHALIPAPYYDNMMADEHLPDMHKRLEASISADLNDLLGPPTETRRR